MSHKQKPLSVIAQEISQLFSALSVEEQEVAMQRLEELMEAHEGKQTTEQFRRIVLAELIMMQTLH
ncbi:hypothetical protein [Tardiphaga sp.]|jgi:hypothetical protein|uniref:hypothetical protein n=1 Tax=Tardiphaga sp. TaxID=1926292 RepID=UPI0037DA0F5A